MQLLLARWEFSVVTIFHFFFVPLTIGLGFMVALMQTLAYRRRGPQEGADWDRLSQFFGRLFLIELAVGVATGITLEFQFGLNWSAYSIFVGNIFGAPLAIEALLAFFMESTFIGLWIFGRGRLSPLLHLLSIWMVSLGTVLSALFILAANSWMQHPVGYKVVHGQAVLTNFWAILGNPMLWGSFTHTVFGALATAAALVLGISVWRARRAATGSDERRAFLSSSRFSSMFLLVTTVLVAISGDLQARLMDIYQPMKMAAAEALYTTKSGASFSLFTVGNLKGQAVFQIRVPHLLSLIADLSWNGQVQGINNIQASEAAKYGAGSYTPVIPLTYWSFRAMVGAGILMIALGAWGLWLSRRGGTARFAEHRWFLRAAVAGMALPFIANSSGWIFTEAGRQPWIVYGLMTTAKGVSTVPTGDLVLTLVAFILVYAAIGAADAWLLVRAARRDLDDTGHDGVEGASVAGLIY
ncbi:MAG TPA: cytochrome ubiquinol oxidase subunit I [Acidimicrobiales bacterium]|nr:cytochrome ubiquinol oxidase subunit I [Acidimicrobiales bacterium]